MSKIETLNVVSDRCKSPALLAGDWLLQSGIQDVGSDLAFRGGMNAWFDLKSQTYPFLYSEITGYAVNIFLFLHCVTQIPAYLEGARLAGDWIIRARDAQYGLVGNRVYHRMDHQSYYNTWVFTFDHWIIIYGLCNLYGATGNRNYLTAAEEMTSFLLKKMFRDNGSIYPVFNLRTGQPEASNDKWSRQSGSFHAKGILGLYQLYQCTGDSKYVSHAVELARYAIREQESCGRFVTQASNQSTHLHPHLYTLEGILFLGIVQNDYELIQICEKGLKWVLKLQQQDGKLSCFFRNNQPVPFERADVLAQTLRLGTVLLQHSESFGQFKPNLDHILDQLLSYQIRAGAQKGGFLYGQEENGMIHYHVNAWVTMFATQALWLYGQLGGIEYPYRFDFFV